MKSAKQDTDPGQVPHGSPVRPVALTIAGSDSGGGAGIQADLKTFHAYGVFGTSVLTAVTAQNTVGVSGIQKVEAHLVELQFASVWEDLRPTACKTGMLVDAAIIRVVAESLRRVAPVALVVDPVMLATSGDPLLEPGAVEALRDLLIPRALLVTPNVPEAAILANMPVENTAQMREAAQRITHLGCRAVLLKGGHLTGVEVIDLLYDGQSFREWRAPKLPTGAGHGTGCTLSAAITAGLALGDDLGKAVDRGLRFTRRALETAPDLGAGTAPLNHWAPVPR